MKKDMQNSGSVKIKAQRHVQSDDLIVSHDSQTFDSCQQFDR